MGTKNIKTVPEFQNNEYSKTKMSQKALCCILDTNTLLHYQLFTEIDWCAELNKKPITLILCSSVISDIDKKNFKVQILEFVNEPKKLYQN